MDIDELIARLQEVKAKHGKMKCYLIGEDHFCEGELRLVEVEHITGDSLNERRLMLSPHQEL